jgi:hypothetical protein
VRGWRRRQGGERGSRSWGSGGGGARMLRQGLDRRRSARTSPQVKSPPREPGGEVAAALGGDRMVPAARGLLFGLLLAASVVGYVRSALGGTLGSDAALGLSLSVGDAAELGDMSLSAADNSSRAGNPWAGAGRRARGDLLVSQPGCGGTYRQAACVGDRVQLRYSARRGGNVVDSTRGRPPVDLVVGSSQAGAELEKALVGLCAGESVRIIAPDGVELLVAVVAVGRGLTGQLRAVRGPVGGEDGLDAEDLVARGLVAVAGRRGASCSSSCRADGLACSEAGFGVVNTCARLRQAFPCAACEAAAAGTAGPDMPCHVAVNAPAGHPRGFCMVNPSARSASCGAKYKHTRRLCPCVRE